MYVRDEYDASQKRGLGCGLWAMWLIATAIGGFLGQVAGQAIVKALLPDEDPSFVILVPVMVLAGIVMGSLIGIAQGLILWRFIALAGYREWVLASALGGALRWTLAGVVGQYLLLNLNLGIVICNILTALIIYGAVSGVIFGLPQSIVLRRRLGESTELDKWAWILANAGGGVLSLPFITLSALTTGALFVMGGIVPDEYAARAIIAVTISWIITGVITGLPLLDRLRYSSRVPANAKAGAALPQTRPNS